MPPVIAVRRDARGMKNLIIDIVILNADPGKRIEMKVALLNVAEESAPFVGADLQLNADALQLFFESLGNSSPQIEIGAFKRELESRSRPVAVGITKSGLI